MNQSQCSPFAGLKQLQSFYQMSLSELLRLDSNKNVLAIALAKSKTQTMTPQVQSLIIERISQQPSNADSWLEVVRRMAQFDYDSAYNCMENQSRLLQPIIVQFFALSCTQQLQNSHFSRLHAQVSSTLRGSQIQPAILTYYINQSIDFYHTIDNINHNNNHNNNNNSNNKKAHSIKMLTKIFELVCSQCKTISTMLQPIDTSITPIGQQMADMISKWSRHYQSVELLRAIVRLMQIMQQIAVRVLQVTQFRQDIRQYRLSILPQHIVSISNMLSTITILTASKLTTTTTNKNTNGVSFISVLEAQPTAKLTNYFTIIVQTITTVSQISSLQHLLYDPHIRDNIVVVMCTTSIIGLNNYNDLNAELLAINEEITAECYSDTLAGCFIRMVVKLCTNVSHYFRMYCHRLTEAVHMTDFANLSHGNTITFVDFMLRLTIISNAHIIKQRQEQIEQLVNYVTDMFVSNMHHYDQFQQIQILRFILAFVGKIDNHSRFGMSDSAEELVVKCVGMCFRCLFPHGAEQMQQQAQYYSASICELTPLQKQCQNILSTLSQSDKIVAVLSRNVPALLSYFVSHARPSIILLQVLQNFIGKIPEIVERSNEELLQFYCRVWEQEMRQIEWRKQNGLGHRMGYGAKIGKILSGYSAILQQASEIPHDLVQSKLIQPVLSKLCLTNCLSQYQPQLLQLLVLTLQKHSGLTPQICMIISKLPVIYAQNQHKLTTLRKLYLVFCTVKHLQSQVLYQHPTILAILVDLMADYFASKLTPEEYCFYVDSVKEMLEIAIVFLNQFAQAILESERMRTDIAETVVKGIDRCFQQCGQFMEQYTSHSLAASSSNSIMEPYRQFQQILLQLAITIAHTLLSPQLSHQHPSLFPTVLSLIASIDMHKLSYICTPKMIPILIIDQLFLTQSTHNHNHNNNHSHKHQQIINDLLRYCAWMRESNMKNGMVQEWNTMKYFDHWTNFPTQNQKVRDYVLDAVRNLKNTKIIDQVEYMEYVNQIQQYMR